DQGRHLVRAREAGGTKVIDEEVVRGGGAENRSEQPRPEPAEVRGYHDGREERHVRDRVPPAPAGAATGSGGRPPWPATPRRSRPVGSALSRACASLPVEATTLRRLAPSRGRRRPSPSQTTALARSCNGERHANCTRGTCAVPVRASEASDHGSPAPVDCPSSRA